LGDEQFLPAGFEQLPILDSSGANLFAGAAAEAAIDVLAEGR
jgi:hypothetical protein